jgi:hypothetical protein
VVEHGRRLVCADCLRRESAVDTPAPRRLPWAAVVQWAVAVAVAWLVFYGLAIALRQMPATRASDSPVRPTR